MKGNPGIVSKHRQFDPDNGKWIEGRVRILADSSLRKLMRAARRGKMPDERQVIIDTAVGKAAKRRDFYLNSSPARRAAG